MDNYDLSNLLLLADCADTRERHPRLTDEENRRATFSGRSATVSTSEQVQRQQLPSTGDEQIPEQKVLANFDISLASTTCAATTTVDEPEDPFAALAAYAARAAYYYQLLTFNDDTGQPLNRNLGLFGNINTSSEAVLAELEGNDGESVIKESSRRTDRLTGKGQKLVSTDTESLPLLRGTTTDSQAAAMPEKSATSQKNTEQNPDESLKERVKKETAKWVVRLKQGVRERFMCGYANCGVTFQCCSKLRTHIFSHIGISIYKCTYPACSANPYFRDTVQLQRHIRSQHTNEKPYHCKLCNMRFGRLDTYKKHVFRAHKLKL